MYIIMRGMAARWGPTGESANSESGIPGRPSTPNFPTNIMGFRGFDSSIILI